MKNNLRKIAKEKRNTLDCLGLSEKIINNLCSSSFYKKAKNIMCYYSFGSEVSTLKLFSDASKNWFLPRIEGDNLLVCPYDKTCLSENKFKILEPTTDKIEDFSILDLIIIPAVCADKNGYRIGYGKGYYDRFLKSVPKDCRRVILTYSELYFDNVYPDIFDEKSDFVITDVSVVQV